MNSDNPAIATPLSEKIATDGNWDGLSTEQTEIFDVLVHLEPGQSDASRSHAEQIGATVKGSYGDTMHVQVRADSIGQLASADSIRLVEELSDPREHSVSEGVSTTNADKLHDIGIKGGSATVVIIDQSFNPDQSEIQDNVIDTVGDSSGFQSGTSGLHGTACAEIVVEMCPNADLILASTRGGYFPSLMNDITAAHDPDVMSMSLGYKQTLRLDGQDALSNRIEEYTSGSGDNTPSAGGLFAVSAGNEANGDHWDGQFQDSTNNGYMEFGGTDPEWFEVNPTQSGQEVVVQSDAPWSSDQNYKLELYDGVGGTQLKSPSKTTTPAQSIPMPGTDTYYLRIKDDGLDGSEHFDLFTWGNYISFPSSTSQRSLGIPATSPDADTLSTGAVRHNTDTLEAFSSRGPTQDGRRGVDIVAPDGTQSDAYNREFYGTSAACPHVAGAAALLFDGTSASNDTIRDELFSTARDISDGDVPAPTNSQIGHGYVDAKAAYDSITASGNFDITIDSVNDPVVEGEKLTVDISVTNTGGNQDEQTIRLDAGGTQVDTQTLSLGAGNSTTISLEYTTSDGDAGTLTLTADSDGNGNSDTYDATVQNPAFFDITIDTVNDPVVEGETLTADISVTNTGDVEGSQTIRLSVGGSVVASQSITVADGSTNNSTLSYSTSDGGAGTVTLTVDSDGDGNSDNYDATVLSPAYFDITIDSVNDPVVEGDPITADISVTNTGDVEGSQTLRLNVGGSVADSQSITLSGGATNTISLSYSTIDGDAGTVTLTVDSDGDGNSDTYDATVQSPAFFDITIDSVNDPVVEGETLTADISVTNTGDVEGSQTIRLSVGGSVVASQSITVADGSTNNSSLSYTTTNDDAETITLAVDSDGDGGSDSYDATVQKDASFEITISSVNDPVVEGDPLTVDVSVANTGDIEGSQTIRLSVGGSVVDSQSITIDGGSTNTISLSYPTSDGDAGTVTLTVDSDGDGNSDTYDATVQSPAFFDITIDSVNDPVVEGETLTASISVTNTGDVEGSQTIGLNADGQQIDTQSLSLGSGESDSIALAYETEQDDADEVTLTVGGSGAGNDASYAASVNPKLFLEATIDQSPIAVDGTATVSIQAGRVDILRIESLWVDWTIASVNPASGQANYSQGDTPQSGTLEIQWDSEQNHVEPSVQLTPNEQSDSDPKYVGGTFLIGVEINGREKEDEVLFEIS